MDTVIVINDNDEDLPEQVTQFVDDLNYLSDEGYLEMREVDGVVRLYPTAR